MKKKKLFTNVITGFCLLITSCIVNAFGGDDLKITQFCNSPSSRQTLIYIDERTLVKDQKQWALDLLNKLSVNLMPSESVTLIKLATENGVAQPLWQGCYPEYSDVQRNKIEKENSGIISLFTSNPLKALPQQKAIFKSQIASALGQLLQQSGRDISVVQNNPENPPNKQIILSLANEAPRFDAFRGAIRVIIYSDMIENSELGSSLTSKPEAAASASVDRSLDFKDAIFYIYGTGSTLSQQESSTAMKLKTFWEAFFTAAEGHLAGFAPNLNIVANIPKTLKIYEVAITISPEDTRFGKMQFFVNEDGSIQDSFITVGNKHQSMLQEMTFACQSDNCQLLATVPDRVITIEKLTSKIELAGSISSMKGTLRIPRSKSKNGKGKEEEFNITAKLTK